MVAKKIHYFLNKLEFRSVGFGGRVKQESTGETFCSREENY